MRGNHRKLNLFQKAKWSLCTWLCSNKEFKDLRVGDLYQAWDGCLKPNPWMRKRQVVWFPPPRGILKFNVDKAARGKPGPAGIRGVLRDHMSSICVVFSEAMGTNESNKVELLSIWRALTLGASLGGAKLEIESDPSHAVKWARGEKCPPWRLVTLVREIKGLSAGREVSFSQISRSAIGVADFFAKNGVEGPSRGVFHLSGG